MTLIIDHIGLLIIISFFWIVFRIGLNIYKRNKINIKNIKKELFFYIFVSYLTLVIGLTIFPIRIGDLREYNNIIINLIPFKFIYNQNIKILIINILGNLFLLAPLPIFLKILNFNKFNSLRKNLLIGFIFSLSIEICQLIFSSIGISDIYRILDINDLILNTIGILIGNYVYNSLFSKLNIIES